MNSNEFVSIRLFSNTFSKGWPKLLEVIGKLLNVIDDEMLLLDDYAFPVMKRKNNVLIVNDQLDKFKSKYITGENLKKLDYPYLQGTLQAAPWR